MQEQRAQELRVAIDRLPLTTRQAMLQGIERNPIIVGADANLRGGLCPMLAASQSGEPLGRPFARAWDRYARARLPRAATERELLTLRSMLDVSIHKEQEPEVSLVNAIASHQGVQQRNQMSERTVLSDTTHAWREQFATSAADEATHYPRALRPKIGRAARPIVQDTEPEVRYSAEQLQPAARVAAARARAHAHRAAEARPAEPPPAQARPAEPRDRPVDTGDRDRTLELASRAGWSWLRPVRRYDDYEQALRDLERELEAVQRERGASSDERDPLFALVGRD